jgi:hypothetical protein
LFLQPRDCSKGPARRDTLFTAPGTSAKNYSRIRAAESRRIASNRWKQIS